MKNLIITAALAHQAAAHLPFVEGERFRFINFQPEAGSWSKWVPEEDLSFEFPFDILTATRNLGTQEPRPEASWTVSSLLATKDDFDVYLYDKQDDQPIDLIAYQLLPACEEYRNFYPSNTILGPLGTIDAETGEEIFKEATDEELEEFPFDIPEGYGHTTGHQNPEDGPRGTFTSEFSETRWITPAGYRDECTTDISLCDWRGGEVSGGLLYKINTPAQYWYVAWRRPLNDVYGIDGPAFAESIEEAEAALADQEGFCKNPNAGKKDDKDKKSKKKDDFDFSLRTSCRFCGRKWDLLQVGGVTDKFTREDFIRFAGIGAARNRGRSVHRECSTYREEDTVQPPTVPGWDVQAVPEEHRAMMNF